METLAKTIMANAASGGYPELQNSHTVETMTAKLTTAVESMVRSVYTNIEKAKRQGDTEYTTLPIKTLMFYTALGAWADDHVLEIANAVMLKLNRFYPDVCFECVVTRDARNTAIRHEIHAEFSD
jgi:hypothetical protein